MTTLGWLYVLAIWVLFFWLYRDYRLALFRHNLFCLRDELFNLAVDGKIDFNHHAYGMLRSAINGNIQYGHRLGFLDVACLLLFTRGRRSREAYLFNQRWNEAISQLSHESRDALVTIRTRMHIRIVEQVFATSAVLMFSLVTVLASALLWIGMGHLKRRVSSILNQILARPKVVSLFDALDYSVAA